MRGGASPNWRRMRTDWPLLVSITEAGFQLSLAEKDILALIRDGELVAVKIRGEILVVYDSLTAFTRRAQQNRAAGQVKQEQR